MHIDEYIERKRHEDYNRVREFDWDWLEREDLVESRKWEEDWDYYGLEYDSEKDFKSKLINDSELDDY